jgi:hypothetical protein
VLLGATAVTLALGWWNRADHLVEAVRLYRVAFITLASAVLVNLHLVMAAWKGRAHISPGITRWVPFEDAEISASSFHPAARYGVSGRGALVGGAVLLLAALIWVAGLAFAPLTSRGTITLPEGETVASAEIPGTGTSYTLDRHHSLLMVGKPEQGVLFQSVDPADGERLDSVLAPGQALVLGDQRLVLVAVGRQPPATGWQIEALGPDGARQDLDLRPGIPVTRGDWTWELHDVDESFLSTGIVALRVDERGPTHSREVWLLPTAPDIDTALSPGPWRLRPLRRLLRPVAQLAVTRPWVWSWRVGVFLLAGLGVGLLLMVPHRSWVWLGQSGDYQLRAWSFNARRTLRQWTDAQLAEVLGSDYDELLAIEAELAARPGGRA